jgi:hypothetical protein
VLWRCSASRRVQRRAPGGPALPQGGNRLAISLDGTETGAELAAVKRLDPIVVLLRTAEDASRLHACHRRRVLGVLNREAMAAPVVHHCQNCHDHCCCCLSLAQLLAGENSV